MKTKLTVSQALAEGYTAYLDPDGGYQAMRDLTDFEEDTKGDIYNRKWVLASKDPIHPDAGDLKGNVIDRILDEWNDRTNSDDLSDLKLVLEAVDFSELETKINEALQRICYYEGTNIYVVSDNEGL